jgi:hypothetical protein
MKYHTDRVNDSRFQIRQDKYILLVLQKLNSDLSPTTPLYVWFVMLMWIMIEYVAIADGMNRIFLRQVGGFLRVLPFHSPIKLTATI